MAGPTRIVTFGNCQADGAKRLLEVTLPAGFRIEFFSNNWRTHWMRPSEDILGAIGEADLVIFQPLKPSYGPLSEESVRETASGQVIAFPYIYNAAISGLSLALRPQPRDGTGMPVQVDDLWNAHPDSLGLNPQEHGLIFGEEAIVARLLAGMSRAQVIRAYEAGRIEFHLRRRFESSMRELARRDAGVELKFSTFIIANHQRERLFHYPTHPATPIFLELLRQLRDVTGLPIDLSRIEDSGNPDLARLGGRGRAPITPSDVEALGYEFEPDERWQAIGRALISMIADKYEKAGNNLPPARTLDPGNAHAERIAFHEEGPAG